MRKAVAFFSTALALGVLAGTATAQAPRAQGQPATTPPAPAASATATPRSPTAEPAPPAAAAGPDRTTATFGDWLLRCERTAEAARSCEVAQVIAVQGSAQPIAQVALGRVANNQPGLTLMVQVPVNVALGTPLRVIGEDRDPMVVETAWQRCVPAGCFAGTDLRDDAVTRLRNRPEPARIEFRDSAGRELRLALSVRGLGPALDALARE